MDLPWGLALRPRFQTRDSLAELSAPLQRQSRMAGLWPPLCLCPFLPQGLESHWVTELFRPRGQLLLGGLCPRSLPLGPSAFGLTISSLLRAWRKPGKSAASLLQEGPSPHLPPSELVPAIMAQPESFLCTLKRLPVPSQLEGSGEIRQGTKASRRLECGAGQEERKVRRRHSQTRQGVCAVFAFRAGKYVGWRL